MTGLLCSPIATQHAEQPRRQHHVAVLAALTLLHPEQHPGAVDVSDLQSDHLRYAEPGGISRRQRHTVLQIRHACQKSRDLVRAQHHWQMPQLSRIGDAFDHRRTPERDAVKEAQGADRLVESIPGDASRDEVHLVGANLRQAQPIRRPLKMLAELGYRMHVTSLRRRRQISDLHVLNHAATQRAHLGHLGNLLSQDWASTTTILSDGRPPRPTPYLLQLLR
jgi:hypothetical protein